MSGSSSPITNNDTNSAPDLVASTRSEEVGQAQLAQVEYTLFPLV